MLKQIFTCPSSFSTSLFPHHHLLTRTSLIFIHSSSSSSSFRIVVNLNLRLSRPSARRRSSSYLGYDDDDEQEEEEDGENYNEELAMLEAYTQSSRNEVLVVTAMVDSNEVEIVIFKGFSSCLSYGTSPDPSRSVLPARAVIKCIDRVKGPFNPSHIEYIEKGLTLKTFKNQYKP